MNHASNHHRTLRVLVLLAGAVLSLGPVAPVLAADPSPPPQAFARPLMLVAIDRKEWIHSEGSAFPNELLEHNDYMLASPDDEVSPGDYAYPDVTGGFFHYIGRNISGPYLTRAELCPFMLANKLEYMPMAPYDPAPTILIAECQVVTAAPSAEASIATDPPPSDAPEPTDAEIVAIGGTETNGPGAYDVAEVDDPIAMEIAVGLILLLLGIGGGVKALGLAFGVGPLATKPTLLDRGVPTDASAVLPDGTTTQPPSSEPDRTRSNEGNDPCSTQLQGLEGASAHARGLNSVLAGLRDFAAQLDQQIVLIEKAAIPAEAGVEAAFLFGGALAPVGGIGWVPDILLGKIFEGVMKDQLKGVIKASLKSAGTSALPGGSEAAETLRDSAAEATLKGMMEDAISAKYLNASISGYHSSLSNLSNSLPRKFELADSIGRNMAEATNHMITLYNAGMSVADLVQQSAVLRQKQAAILDDISNIELAFEGATERMANLAQDLERCRWVHSPTKEPLRQPSA